MGCCSCWGLVLLIWAFQWCETLKLKAKYEMSIETERLEIVALIQTISDASYFPLQSPFAGVCDKLFVLQFFMRVSTHFNLTHGTLDNIIGR